MHSFTQQQFRFSVPLKLAADGTQAFLNEIQMFALIACPLCMHKFE